jgi:hypothetical protein
MAGSIKWMKYVSDDGNTYRVKIDESNGENHDFDDVTTASADAMEELPKGYQMRHVLWRSDTGNAGRKFYCGKPTSADFIIGGNSIVNFLIGTALGALDGSFTRAVGEARSLFKNAAGTGATSVQGGDTGLNDGDAT